MLRCVERGGDVCCEASAARVADSQERRTPEKRMSVGDRKQRRARDARCGGATDSEPAAQRRGPHIRVMRRHAASRRNRTDAAQNVLHK